MLYMKPALFRVGCRHTHAQRARANTNNNNALTEENKAEKPAHAHNKRVLELNRLIIELHFRT
eukprot:2518600-Alexandrium_andersonii.AAC.1